MGFSRQEQWSGLPCLPLGDLPDSGIEPKSLKSPSLASGFFTTSITWETLKGTLWLQNRRQSFSFLNQSPSSVPTSYSRNQKELRFRVMYKTGVGFWCHLTGVPESCLSHAKSPLSRPCMEKVGCVYSERSLYQFSGRSQNSILVLLTFH